MKSKSKLKQYFFSQIPALLKLLPCVEKWQSGYQLGFKLLVKPQWPEPVLDVLGFKHLNRNNLSFVCRRDGTAHTNTNTKNN